MELSRRGKHMPASPIRKLAALAEEAVGRGVRVYHLNIGQPDIPTPGPMLDAVRGYQADVLAYGPSGGLWEARREIASYMCEIGSPVNPSQVLVTTGGSEALLFSLMAVCDPGDDVLVFEPFYTNYGGFAHQVGVRLVPLPTSVDDGYRPPGRDAILDAVTPRTRVILYCSPANPTGTVMRRGEVEEIVRVAMERDLFVVADEVYREFAYDGVEHVGLLDVALELGCPERAIVVDSISKRFSACGARIGTIATHNPEVLDACLRFGQARLCPPTIEQYAAMAGYAHLEEFVPPMIREFRDRRDVVMDALGGMDGVVCSMPEGAFYVMPRLPVDDSESFARFLLTDFQHDGRTVMVAPGPGFYATAGKGRDEVRIAYVLNVSDLRTAMDLLRRGLEAYPGAS